MMIAIPAVPVGDVILSGFWLNSNMKDAMGRWEKREKRGGKNCLAGWKSLAGNLLTYRFQPRTNKYTNIFSA